MSSVEPRDAIRGDAGEGRLREWLLLTANRNMLAGVLAVGLFCTLVVAGVANATPLRALVREGTHVERLFQSFTMSLVTVITLVVTLNQLVLSRELGPLGEQRDRMSGSVEFRRDVEELFGSVAPAEPAPFMRAFMTLSSERAAALRDAIAGTPDEELRDGVDAFAEHVGTRADEAHDRLGDARFGRFEVVRVALNYDYSRKIREARRLRTDHAESLGADERAAFDDLLDVLHLFAPAREHIKTLYIRWELVTLSRGMLYVGVPALAVSIASLLYLNPNSFAGSTLGVSNLVVVISAATAVAATPFFLLVAHVLRLGTITQRTLAIGPFVLGEPRTSESDDEASR